MEYPDNLNDLLARQIEHRIGEMGKEPPAYTCQLTIRSWPRGAQMRELYQPFKDVAEVIKKTRVDALQVL